MRALCTTLILASLWGCGLVDPDRPVPYPDEPVFGNLLEVEQLPDQAGEVVRLRAGAPRALGLAKAAEGRPTPEVEKGTVAEVQVGEETVVMVAGRPAGLDALNPGSEVVALPVLGTTTMVGASTLRMTASYLMDFDTYRRWRLPGLGGGGGTNGEEPTDDERPVNSAGVEGSPVPLQGGRVLYFSARLRLPVSPDQPLIGTRRAGLEPASPDQPPPERSFRVEQDAAGWGPAKPVSFPDLNDAVVVRVSWVNEEETACLVTVRRVAEPPWVGRATRPSASAPWGAVERLAAGGEGFAQDAVYLAGSKKKLTFVVRPPAAVQTELVLFDPAIGDEPQLLAPNINTAGDEWCPRVGPDNELFFCRGENQLILTGGTVRALRLPGPYRRLLSQANPTRDRKWVFFCSPRLTPVELDQDIWVAPWLEGITLGEPVPVDEWRP